MNGLVTVLVAVTGVAFVKVTTQRKLDRQTGDEVRQLFSQPEISKQSMVRSEDLNGLPSSVRRWMESSGVVGKKKPASVRLTQTGEMRRSLDEAWMKFAADYYYRVDRPGFVWDADVKWKPLVHLFGRDKLIEGHGNMTVKMFKIMTLVDAQGPEIDQGSLVRYLAETVWFPAAALNNFITWENAGANSARATIRDGNITASGTFTFDAKGNVVQFTAPRYMAGEGGFELRTWKVNLSEHREVNGIHVPTSVEVIWDLPDGEFDWFKGNLINMEYDRPEYFGK